MMKIIKYLYLLMIPFISCNAQEAFPLYEKYADEIMNKFADDMEKKFKVFCTGSGGQMPYDVETVHMGFEAFRPVTLQEARQLKIFLTEELITRINTHEKIRPFLKEFPFTQKRVQIFIAFRKKDGSPFPQDYISFVTHARDRIYYFKKDTTTNKYFDFCDEPYEEALRIVKNQD